MTIRNCTSKGQKATYYVVYNSNAGTSIIRHAFLDLAGVPRLGGRASTWRVFPPDKQGK